jgi:predicted kinase
MRIEEILAPVEEGVNDPHIFKAVFMAGGPGSGKSFIANKLLGGTGLKTVNSDEIYEWLMQKADMPLDPETIASPKGQETRNRAKELTKKRETYYLDGRLGLIIDGTGKDVAKVSKANEKLKELGYDTMMLFVNTSEEVAQERNLQRARSIPKEMVTKMWNAVQQNLMKFQQVFGAANFHVVDNSGGLEDPERKENFMNVDKSINRFLSAQPKLPAAKQWIQSQKR